MHMGLELGERIAPFLQQEVIATASKLSPANHKQAFLSQERKISRTCIKDSTAASSVNGGWVRAAIEAL